MKGLAFRLVHAGLLLLGLLPCTGLHAQGVLQISPGERVRISSTALSDRVAGTVLGVRGPTLIVRAENNDTVYASWPDIRRLETSLGASRSATAVRYGGIGLLVGGATGALFGYATYEDANESEWCLMLCSRKDATVFGGTLLGIITGTVGGILGALAPAERWERVALPASAEISLQGSSVVVSVPLVLP